MTTSINDDEPESDISGSLPVSLSSHFRSEKTKMSKLLTLYQTEAADLDSKSGLIADARLLPYQSSQTGSDDVIFDFTDLKVMTSSMEE